MEHLYFKESIPWPMSIKSIVCDKMVCTYQDLGIDFLRPHTHADYWEFTVLLEGSIINYLNGKPHLYPKGTLFFLTTEDYHHIKRKANQKIRYINILIKNDFIIKYLNIISPDFYQSLINGPRDYDMPDNIIIEIEDIIRIVNMIPHTESKKHSDLVFSALMLLIQHLYTKFLQPPQEQAEWKNQLLSLVGKTEFYTFTSSDLCRELNYSKAQLTRIFKKEFNLTPHEYLQEHKFRHALNLLVYTNSKIIEIANKLGFKNLSQFNVVFKQKYGMTPGEYRKHNR